MQTILVSLVFVSIAVSSYITPQALAWKFLKLSCWFLNFAGCPNATLVREKTALATKYHNRSVAEQNSLDICWQILKSPKYDRLRACIYTNDKEMKRFRQVRARLRWLIWPWPYVWFFNALVFVAFPLQLVVNSIIATDISDKSLGAQRRARWNVAFQSQPGQDRCATEECSVAAQAAVVCGDSN